MAAVRISNSKYNNRKTEVDGIIFDSAKEAARYKELKLLEAARQISDLKLQAPFTLLVNGVLVATYKADFVYWEKGKRVVEDVKGCRTQMYIMKRKLMKACYGIDIKET